MRGTWDSIVGGRVTDNHNVASIYGRVEALFEHVHSASYCYPTLAVGVNIPGGVGAWQLGAITEVVPAATILSDFDIHFINIEVLSANDVYELVLYYGAADTYAGRCRFTRVAVLESANGVPMMTPIIPASSRIRAQLASASGGDNVTISVSYHVY